MLRFNNLDWRFKSGRLFWTELFYGHSALCCFNGMGSSVKALGWCFIARDYTEVWTGVVVTTFIRQKVLNIQALDHVIIGESDFFSLKREELM